MGTFKGTPGPWKFRVNATADGFYIQSEDEDRFDSFIGDVGGGLQLKKEIETNAKLIAAAPELLEALNAITDNIETWLNTGVAADKNISEELYNNAVSAIKKATE